MFDLSLLLSIFGYEYSIFGKDKEKPIIIQNNVEYVFNVGIEEKQTLTPISQEDLASVLRQAYKKIYDKDPSRNILGMAWSHVALENQTGKKVWNYNLGNIGPLNTSENYYDHFGKTKYRSFKSFDEGAEAYWKFMERCPRALQAFGWSDVSLASQFLKSCNYYGADIDQYVRTLSNLRWKGLYYSDVVLKLGDKSPE